MDDLKQYRFEIDNLEELMQDAKWFDQPSEDGILCFSFRCCQCQIDGETYWLTEGHHCQRQSQGASITLRKPGESSDNAIRFRCMLPYYRDPHTAKTYVRNDLNVAQQDLSSSSSGRQEWKPNL